MASVYTTLIIHIVLYDWPHNISGATRSYVMQLFGAAGHCAMIFIFIISFTLTTFYDYPYLQIRN